MNVTLSKLDQLKITALTRVAMEVTSYGQENKVEIESEVTFAIKTEPRLEANWALKLTVNGEILAMVSIDTNNAYQHTACAWVQSSENKHVFSGGLVDLDHNCFFIESSTLISWTDIMVRDIKELFDKQLQAV